MTDTQMSTTLVPVTHPQTHHIPQAMWDEAVHLLKSRRLVRLAEFDERLATFATQVPDALRVAGSRRTRRKNLADHVKAQLTRLRLTRYLTIGRVEHIAWLPASGVVHDVAVVDREDVLRLLAAVQSAAAG